MRQHGLERPHWLGALLLGTAFCFGGPAARGDETAGAAPRPGVARSPVQWLQAIRAAAQRTNYTGTIVYQRGDEVQCLYPKLHRVVIEQTGGRATFPALGQFDLGRVLEHYVLTVGDVERVAGLECRVLQLMPRDALRYGYKLWVEPDSGLLLKTQVVGGDDSVIEQIAFSDVRVGGSIDPAQLRPSWSTAGWEVVRHASHQTELSRQGWSITAPEGFQMLTQVERNLRNDSHAALQAVYSDGLATVSVFIEPGAVLAEPEAAQHRGPSSAFMRQVGDARVTVVGEVPPTTARSIAESVRFVASH